jgi:6-methylsalicylate decarboxylase
LADRIDIHQHLWTGPLIEALARRDCPPFARPANGRFVLYSGQEAPATVDAGDPAVEHRLADLDRDGIGRAMVSISSRSGSSRFRGPRPSP